MVSDSLQALQCRLHQMTSVHIRPTMCHLYGRQVTDASRYTTEWSKEEACRITYTA